MLRIPIDTLHEEIRRSVVCLAEITPDNPNVWYELGFSVAKRSTHRDDLQERADAAIRHAPPEHSFLYTFKPLELALEAKNLTFGLYCCLQRRRFRGRFPPQLEGDFGQAAVGLSYPFEQVLSFVFSHGTWISMCISTAQSKGVRRQREWDTGASKL